MTDRMRIDSDADGTVVHLEMVLQENPEATTRPSDILV
jgi:hypothetical protein